MDAPKTYPFTIPSIAEKHPECLELPGILAMGERGSYQGRQLTAGTEMLPQDLVDAWAASALIKLHHKNGPTNSTRQLLQTAELYVWAVRAARLVTPAVSFTPAAPEQNVLQEILAKLDRIEERLSRLEAVDQPNSDTPAVATVVSMRPA